MISELLVAVRVVIRQSGKLFLKFLKKEVERAKSPIPPRLTIRAFLKLIGLLSPVSFAKTYRMLKRPLPQLSNSYNPASHNLPGGNQHRPAF